MIYDNIKNIGLYKGLSSALDVALDYIAAAKMPLEDGTTLLEHGVKAVVSSYVTKGGNPKGYEAHLKYADVQFLLAGEEVMRCCPLEYLTPSTEYDGAKDCLFYVEDRASHPASWSEGIDSAVALRLGAGYFAVVFPDDAHIPQLAVGTPAEVQGCQCLRQDDRRHTPRNPAGAPARTECPFQGSGRAYLDIPVVLKPQNRTSI